MKKVIKKIVCIAVLLTILFSLAGCKEEFEFNCIMVFVHEAYQENINAEEINIENFQWSNIKEIEYVRFSWPGSQSTDVQWINVYLVKQRKRHRKAAVEHIEKLYFVKYAEAVYNGKWA